MGIWKRPFMVKLDHYPQKGGVMSDAEWVDYYSEVFGGHSSFLRLCVRLIRRLIRAGVIRWNLRELAEVLHGKDEMGPTPGSSRPRPQSLGRLLREIARGRALQSRQISSKSDRGIVPSKPSCNAADTVRLPSAVPSVRSGS